MKLFFKTKKEEKMKKIMKQEILKVRENFYSFLKNKKEDLCQFCLKIQSFMEEKTPENSNSIGIFIISIFCLPSSVLARDFLASVENASSQIRQIIAVVGVLALMIAGVCFYWSKKLGMEKLSAAIIGTVVFASAGTIFTLFYQAFN